MEFVFRAAAIYFFLLLLFAIGGKRSLAEMDTFDLVLLLVISEATEQALIGETYSLTTACLVIATLVGLEIFMTNIKQRWHRVEQATTGGPVILFHNGHFFKDRMSNEKIDEAEILAAAREKRGISNFDNIKFAILESGGSISIIPRESDQDHQKSA